MAARNDWGGCGRRIEIIFRGEKRSQKRDKFLMCYVRQGIVINNSTSIIISCIMPYSKDTVVDGRISQANQLTQSSTIGNQNQTDPNAIPKRMEHPRPSTPCNNVL